MSARTRKRASRPPLPARLRRASRPPVRYAPGVHPKPPLPRPPRTPAACIKTRPQHAKRASKTPRPARTSRPSALPRPAHLRTRPHGRVHPTPATPATTRSVSHPHPRRPQHSRCVMSRPGFHRDPTRSPTARALAGACIQTPRLEPTGPPTHAPCVRVHKPTAAASARPDSRPPTPASLQTTPVSLTQTFYALTWHPGRWT